MEEKKEKEELRDIDFAKAEIENIDGSKSKIFVDGDGEIGVLVKQFANVIYSQSKELGEVEVEEYTAQKMLKGDDNWEFWTNF